MARHDGFWPRRSGASVVRQIRRGPVRSLSWRGTSHLSRATEVADLKLATVDADSATAGMCEEINEKGVQPGIFDVAREDGLG